MKRNIRPIASICFAFALLAAWSGRAATLVWTNTAATGNWSFAANWSPNLVPGPADTAVLPVLGNNSYAVTLDITGSVSNLTVGASSGASTQTFSTGAQTLTVNGVITVNAQGTFNFDGGTLAGTNVLVGTLLASSGTLSGVMTVSNNGVLNLTNGQVFFAGLTLTNYGTVNWTNAPIYSGDGAQCYIYNYGLWDAQSDNGMEGDYGGGATVFDNFGTFRKSGNTGTTTLDAYVTLTNTGTVDVESGTLSINGGGESSGSGVFYAGSEGTNLFNTSYNFLGASSFSGPGSVVLAGGTATVNGLITNVNVLLSDATLTGTNILEGALTVVDATLSGVMTVSNHGVLNLANGEVFFTALTLTNYGTANWTNAPIYSGGGTLVSIYNYGLWDAQSDNGMEGDYGGGATMFDNFGTFRKSGSTGTTTLDAFVTLTNTGTVDVESGTLSLYGGGENSGSGVFYAGSGGTNLFYASYNFLGTSSFSGSGGVVLAGGTATVNGLITNANVLLSDATLTGTNVLEGTLTMVYATLSGVMTISNTGVLNLPNAEVFFAALTLTNYGTVNWTDAPIYSGGGTQVNIYNYGLWDAQSDNGIEGDYGGGATLFDNLGTFRKSGNAGITTLDGFVTFTNTGTVDVESGFLSIVGLDSTGGTFTGGGVVQMSSGTATLNGLITSANLQMTGGTLTGTNVLEGTLTMTEGTLSGVMTVTNNGVLNIQNGQVFFAALTLTNYGTVNWTNTPIYSGGGTQVNIYNYGLWDAQSDNSLVGDYGGGETAFYNIGTFRKSGTAAGDTYLDQFVALTNTGTVDAEAGTLSLNTYDLTGGALNFGISALTNFGVVNLAGIPASLTGTISGNFNSNYIPMVGDSFLVINFSSSSGVFTSTNLPQAAVWQTAYDASDVTITVLKLVPQFTWANPADIVYGTTLSGTQLDANAASPTNLGGSLAGTLTYTPPLGTLLFASNNQTLSVTFAPTDSATYTNVTTNVTINVQRRPVNLTGTRTYDATITAASTILSVVNAVGSDVVNTASGNATLAAATVGSESITSGGSLVLGGAQSANYTPTGASGSVAISAKTLTMSGLTVPSSKVYNGTTAAVVSGSPGSLQSVETPGTGSSGDGKPYNGDTVSLTGAATGTYNSKDVATASTVTFAGVSLTGGQANDYNLTIQSPAAASITVKALSMSGLSVPSSKVYNATLAAIVSGSPGTLQAAEGAGSGSTGDGKPYTGDTVSLSGTAMGAYNSKDVATATTVTFGNLTLGGAQAGDYSLTIQGTAPATITAKTLTMSGLTVPSSKVYDGTTAAVVGGSPGTLQSADAVGTGSTADGKPYAGDTVLLSGPATGNYNSKDVATASTVTFAGVSLGGAQAGDYSLTIQGTAPATITAKTLTMSGLTVPSSKVYDGTTAAVVSGSPGTLQAAEAAGTGSTGDGKPYTGDTLSLSGPATGTYNSKDVTTASTVTFAGVNLGGAQAGDYNLTIQGTAAATITAKTLTMSGLSVPSSKVYDGTTAAVVSGSPGTLQSAEVTGTGSIADGKPYTGDTVSLAGPATGTYNSKDVTTASTVTFAGVSLGGAQAGDYSLTVQGNAAATITAKTLTMSGLSVPSSKVYDGTTAAVVSGSPGTLQSAEVTGTGSIADGKPYTGDTVSLAGPATGTYNSKDVTTASTVTFAGVSLGGAQAGDYSLTVQGNAAATITAKTLTMSGLSVPSSKIYNGTTAAVVGGSPGTLQAAEGAGTGSTGDGKPYTGDTLSLNGPATGTYNSKDVATASTVTFAGVTLGGTQAGDYSLTIQGTDAATITAKNLTMSGLTVPSSKVYDGTTTAVVSGSPGTLQSAEGAGTGTTGDGKPYTGDTLNLSGPATGTYNSKDVATASTVTFAGVNLGGAQAGDYSLTIQGTVAATITKATATILSGITANNKFYDHTTTATLSSNSVALSGAFSGDTLSLVTNGYTANFSTASVGNGLAVTMSGLTLSGTGSGNYNLTQPSGLTASIVVPALNFTVTPPNMVLSWATSASAFVLNRTPSLTSPVTLTSVTTGITVNGTNNTITISTSSGNQFYLLVAP